jgi:hypothetical protein
MEKLIPSLSLEKMVPATESAPGVKLKLVGITLAVMKKSKLIKIKDSSSFCLALSSLPILNMDTTGSNITPQSRFNNIIYFVYIWLGENNEWFVHTSSKTM